MILNSDIPSKLLYWVIQVSNCVLPRRGKHSPVMTLGSRTLGFGNRILRAPSVHLRCVAWHFRTSTVRIRHSGRDSLLSKSSLQNLAFNHKRLLGEWVPCSFRVTEGIVQCLLYLAISIHSSISHTLPTAIFRPILSQTSSVFFSLRERRFVPPVNAPKT